MQAFIWVSQVQFQHKNQILNTGKYQYSMMYH